MRGNSFWWVKRALGLLLLVLALLNTGCGHRQGFFTVTRVIDGDTFIVKMKDKEERVRLIGVDTPETKAPGKEQEPYGTEAEAFTRKLLQGKQVRLELDVQERDRYGRILAYAYLPEGTFINAKLVQEGYARVMTVPPNVRYADLFLQLEREARMARRGLWGLDPGPAAPPKEEKKLIKGNISSSGEKIYHVPGGAFYDRTVAEELFATEEEAVAAGYRKSKR
ncbi:MAG: thermonuclease family protein [Bacillota bacterium]